MSRFGLSFPGVRKSFGDRCSEALGCGRRNCRKLFKGLWASCWVLVALWSASLVGFEGLEQGRQLRDASGEGSTAQLEKPDGRLWSASKQTQPAESRRPQSSTISTRSSKQTSLSQDSKQKQPNSLKAPPTSEPQQVKPSDTSAAAESSDQKRPNRLVRVTFFNADGNFTTVKGKVLVEAVDGGLLVLGRDGQLWTVLGAQLKKREELEEPFRPLNKKELAQELVSELRQQLPGVSPNIVTTRHYVICSTASVAYARWTGALFERLYNSFRRFWRSAHLKLHDPEFPLPAVVLASRKQFVKIASREVKDSLTGVSGFYSIQRNRMVMFDLTCLQSRGGVGQTRTATEIVRRLARTPENVATIIHEATHQIAFNCGFHRRFADNPLWLVEGLATFFETPDLTSRTGWRSIGKPNPVRLRVFKQYVASGRPTNSLKSLVASNQRFLSSPGDLYAYGEAWALTFFLIKRKRPQYVRYVSRLAQKPLLHPDSPTQKLQDFEACFGSDWQRLDREFLSYILRLR